MIKCFLFLLIFWHIILPVHAQWLWNAKTMYRIKKEITAPAYTEAYTALIFRARLLLNKNGYSVTKKEGIAPSGDKHDYVSLSRYWWPNPQKTNGLPYIFKDGQSNPELEKYDRNELGDMCFAIHTLSLAFFYSENEEYASKAVKFLKTWFVDTATKMNPHLEYSQFIPGRDNSKGRPEGLIDSYSFVDMISSIQLLRTSTLYTKQLDEYLKNWFGQFASWLMVSKQGQAERSAKNNHATAYDSQLITYLLFSGNEREAVKIINEFPVKRIFAQIEPDGKQPNELWRTLAYHYSEYNLSHMLDVCATSEKLGIDLLHKKSTDGRCIYAAMDYLLQFLGKDVNIWPYKQISGWQAKQQDICLDLIKIVNMDPMRKDYRKIFNKYIDKNNSAEWRLLYGLND